MVLRWRGQAGTSARGYAAHSADPPRTSRRSFTPTGRVHTAPPTSWCTTRRSPRTSRRRLSLCDPQPRPLRPAPPVRAVAPPDRREPRDRRCPRAVTATGDELASTRRVATSPRPSIAPYSSHSPAATDTSRDRHAHLWVHARRDRARARPSARDGQLPAQARPRRDAGGTMRDELERVVVPRRQGAIGPRGRSRIEAREALSDRDVRQTAGGADPGRRRVGRRQPTGAGRRGQGAGSRRSRARGAGPLLAPRPEAGSSSRRCGVWVVESNGKKRLSRVPRRGRSPSAGSSSPLARTSSRRWSPTVTSGGRSRVATCASRAGRGRRPTRGSHTSPDVLFASSVATVGAIGRSPGWCAR